MPTRSSIPDKNGQVFAPSRRAVLAAVSLAPLLARCSSDPNSDTSALAHMLGQSVDVIAGSKSVTLSEVASTPFASLGVRIGSGAQAMLVLASRTAQSTIWTSASHIALEISSGRILRTAGLAQNLSATTFPGIDPLEAGLQNLRAPANAKRALDFSDLNVYGVVVESVLSPSLPADVDVLGTRIACVHAVERCSCPSLGWSFANEYWAGGTTGLVWRSVQSFHPAFDPLEIELFRPPKA